MNDYEEDDYYDYYYDEYSSCYCADCVAYRNGFDDGYDAALYDLGYYE